MKKILSTIALTLFVAASAVAHSGHAHQILGTVKVLRENQMVIVTSEGKEATVNLTSKTKFTKSGKAAKREDLEKGKRVSVSVSDDSKTAVSIKIGAAKKTK